MPERYVDCGTEPFIAINWHKVRYIRWLLDHYRHVVYADLDVGSLADPLWYPGFLSARSSEVTLQLLDTALQLRRPVGRGAVVDEQNTLDAMITQDPGLLEHVHLLSEGLFVNGLGYRNLLDQPAAVTPMLGRLEPFVFHANWTVGLANKRKLMAQTGTWLLGAPESAAGGE
jgi:hypothetical protein